MPRASIDVSEEAGVRYLHFGSEWIQGAMRIARPFALELDYTREMMAALLLRHEVGWPQRVLVIGLGAASVVKFLYRHRPRSHLRVVEIEPALVPVAYHHFKLPDDPARIELVIGDGSKLMLTDPGQYDLILVDGFDAHARSGPLETLPFYDACRQRLSADGLLCANLLGRNRSFPATVRRLRTVFDGRALVFPSCDSGNVIAFAATGNPIRWPMKDLRIEASRLKGDTGLNLLPTLTRLEQAGELAGETLIL